jgi:glutamine amidotransferase
MCQLLGVCANTEVDIRFSFREWRHRGEDNPHGYGFAHWAEGELRVEKSASSLLRRAHSDLEVTAASSRIFLAHVRLKSVGPQDGSNTHPFRGTAEGRAFAFAHNGTVPEVKARPLRQRAPGGQTDSEHAFLLLLEEVAGASGKELDRRLKAAADGIRALGGLNFLLSDGATLWAYADDSLHFVERGAPCGGHLVTLQDDGYSVDLAEVKRPGERAVLVATRPLTDEPGWQSLEAGELLVVRDGGVADRIR